ncbi:YhcG family protein [Rhodonellum sp.]|uniref:PDDEXK nuclease domain-containing protein n=1 Tax=Rhodonellum sp. TaxID=2231180 RepID=UPI00271E80B4|nr:PDDEXK nuclease domain-containing protein [Rhodonellum sp.]MDO9554639.1 PDDEXK nuclease domain-containing protein [Rhodonellum sp.]
MEEDKKLKPDKAYAEALKAIVKTIELAQVKIVIAANTQLLWAYWKIGNELSARTKINAWGAKVIDTLSKDLRKKFPAIKGFSARNLLYMRQFAEAYTPDRILHLNNLWEQAKTNTQQLVALLKSNDGFESDITQPPVAQFDEINFTDSLVGKISWSHHLVLIDKCPKMANRFWYMLNTLEHGISKNMLLMQIEAGLFERQIALKKVSNFTATLPAPQSDFANYLLKDPYIFDFVQAKEQADERNIEEQLTRHITQFLLELGQGFAFVGKQYPMRVGGKDYHADLLFYHTKLHCYVVVELKARAFEPSDPAQLNFYINVINDILKTEQDNDTIGILLCKGKNEIIAEYALKGYNQPIGVADYVLSKAVPENLQSTLPQIEELEQELKQLDHEN